MTKQNYIFVRYSVNPNWPDEISHKCPHLHKLTKAQTKKFELSQYNEAWNFIMECSSPITKLANILWAFPKKEALSMLKAMDELKQDIPEFVYQDLMEIQDDETLEDTLMNMRINDKTYSELLCHD